MLTGFWQPYNFPLLNFWNHLNCCGCHIYPTTYAHAGMWLWSCVWQAVMLPLATVAWPLFQYLVYLFTPPSSPPNLTPPRWSPLTWSRCSWPGSLSKLPPLPGRRNWGPPVNCKSSSALWVLWNCKCHLLKLGALQCYTSHNCKMTHFVCLKMELSPHQRSSFLECIGYMCHHLW